MASDPANARALADGAGLIWSFGALDFAGGTVVHINSGIAALVGALILGNAQGLQAEPMPSAQPDVHADRHRPSVGRLVGFNAGSNLESNGYAGLALINTLRRHGRCGALSWGLAEAAFKKKPSLLGMASGASRVLSRSRLRPASPVRWARSCSASSSGRSACSPARVSRTCWAMTTASTCSASTAWAASSAPSAPASSSPRTSAALASSTIANGGARRSTPAYG